MTDTEKQEFTEAVEGWIGSLINSDLDEDWAIFCAHGGGEILAEPSRDFETGQRLGSTDQLIVEIDGRSYKDPTLDAQVGEAYERMFPERCAVPPGAD